MYSLKTHISILKNTKKKVNAQKLQNLGNFQASRRTIQRALKRLGFNYSNVCKKIVLKPVHKKVRVEIITNWIAQRIDWKKVVFTDEKKFNLDGPDNWGHI